MLKKTNTFNQSKNKAQTINQLENGNINHSIEIEQINELSNYENYITCIYEIVKPRIIQILNSYELNYQKNSNLKGENNGVEIKKNCLIYLNNLKIPFGFKCNFKKEGKNEIKIIFKNNITIANYLFSLCSSIKSLDLSNFDSSNVTNMSYMFYNCSSLTNLKLSKLNTKNVIDMNNMFSNCSSITNIDLSNFNTDNVTNMSSMFEKCSSLINLN